MKIEQCKKAYANKHQNGFYNRAYAKVYDSEILLRAGKRTKDWLKQLVVRDQLI